MMSSFPNPLKVSVMYCFKGLDLGWRVEFPFVWQRLRLDYCCRYNERWFAAESTPELDSCFLCLNVFLVALRSFIEAFIAVDFFNVAIWGWLEASLNLFVRSFGFRNIFLPVLLAPSFGTPVEVGKLIDE